MPVRTLIDYIEGGYTLDEFLAEFPTVTRDRALELLSVLKQLVSEEEYAHPVGRELAERAPT